MTLLALPVPFDFELSTGRFRAFGTDLANRLEDGVLHRAVAGREVRIRAAPGGVDVSPLDDETRPVVLKLLGAEFELEPFYRDSNVRQVLTVLGSAVVSASDSSIRLTRWVGRSGIRSSRW